MSVARLRSAIEQLEERAKRGLCFGGCHGDVTILFVCPSKWDFEYFCKMLYDFILGGLGAVLCSKLLKFGIKFPNPSTFEYREAIPCDAS